MQCYQLMVDSGDCPPKHVALCPVDNRVNNSCQSLNLEIRAPHRYYCACGEKRSKRECLDLLSDAKMDTMLQETHVELDEVSTTEWTFIAVSNKYRTEGNKGGTFGMQNMRQKKGGNSGLNLPLGPSDTNSFFQAIEINTPMLISPIMMVPQYRTPKQLQEMYIQNFNEMSTRKGPLVTNRERINTRVPVDKADFAERSTLMSAPIIFQTRARKTATCPFSYSTRFIQNMHVKAVEENCDGSIYACDDSVVSRAEEIMACMGKIEVNDTYFGITPTLFNGKTGYADFLASITDSPFLFRDGIVSTDTFINSATQKVEVVFVFFTPRSGLVSVLTIKAEMSHEIFEPSITVKHYAILEGDHLKHYLIVQGFVLFMIFVLLVDAFYIISKTRKDWIGGDFQSSALFQPLSDLVCCGLQLWYTVTTIQRQLKSKDSTEDILKRLESIPWSSTADLEPKMVEFFDTTKNLLGLIAQGEFNDKICMAILMINLFRVIQCTSLHPRLALLTGTVANAADDLWHTAILTMLIMVCFGAVGTWRFGNMLAEFGSFERTLQTEFEMLLSGSFPAN